MKRFAILAAPLLLIAAMLCHGGRARSQPAAESTATQAVPDSVRSFATPVDLDSGDSALLKKLKERHNSGVELLKHRLQEYKQGRRDISFVFEAARLVAQAKLELAENDDARRAVLTQTLEVAQQIERHLDEQLAAGFGSAAERERARFARLGVEVELLRLDQ